MGSMGATNALVWAAVTHGARDVARLRCRETGPAWAADLLAAAWVHGGGLRGAPVGAL